MKISIKQNNKSVPKQQEVVCFFSLNSTKHNPRIRVIHFKNWHIAFYGEMPNILYPYRKVKYYFTSQYGDKTFRVHKRKFKLWINEVVLRKPVYYEYFSRDCDCVEVSGYKMAKNRKEFNRTQENMWESAEGECRMTRCSKSEYEEYGDEVNRRDRVMEGFENGNNFYI